MKWIFRISSPSRKEEEEEEKTISLPLEGLGGWGSLTFPYLHILITDRLTSWFKNIFSRKVAFKTFIKSILFESKLNVSIRFLTSTPTVFISYDEGVSKNTGMTIRRIKLTNGGDKRFSSRFVGYTWWLNLAYRAELPRLMVPATRDVCSLLLTIWSRRNESSNFLSISVFQSVLGTPFPWHYLSTASLRLPVSDPFFFKYTHSA